MNLKQGAGVRRACFSTLLLIGLFAAQGASAQTITISNAYVSNSGGSPVSVAVYALSYNGDIVTSNATGNGTSDTGDWLTPKTGMSNYQVRATASTCSGPAVGEWRNLGSGPNWYKVSYAGVTSYCSVTIQITTVADPSTVLGTATIALTSGP